VQRENERGKEARRGKKMFKEESVCTNYVNVHVLKQGSKDNFYLEDKKARCHGQWSRPTWLRIRVCGGIF